MHGVSQITLEAIKKDEELVAQQAVEFWSTICDVEIDILLEIEDAAQGKFQPRACLNFIKGALPFLLPVLLETLTKQVPHLLSVLHRLSVPYLILLYLIMKESEEQDEDAWNVSTAAGTCIALIANTVMDDIVPIVMPFVRDNINHQNWRFREAATLAFGTSLFFVCLSLIEAPFSHYSGGSI